MNTKKAESVEPKAQKYLYRLGGRKSVASFVPGGYNPQRLLVRFSRIEQLEDERWWRPIRKIKTKLGRRTERVYELSIKIDTARALHATLGSALKDVSDRSGISAHAQIPMLPMSIEAEPCKLTWRQKIYNRLLGW